MTNPAQSECQLPPDGWACSREAGHEGPCAARPTRSPDDGPVSWAAMFDDDGTRLVTPEAMARAFHEAYESLAEGFGYQTRAESAVPWEDVPEANKALMIATVRNVLIERGLRLR